MINQDLKTFQPYLGFINITLCLIVVSLVFYYIIMANQVASQRYQVQVLSSQLSNLTEKNTILATDKLKREDISILIQFAAENNFVQAHNTLRLFADREVALGR